MTRLPTRRPLSVEEIEGTDWVPHALFRAKVEDFLGEGMVHHRGVDGLDAYEGAFGSVHGVRVGLIRHRGNPGGAVQMHMGYEAQDVELITAVVAMVVREFGVDPENLVWERRDGNDEATHAAARARFA